MKEILVKIKELYIKYKEGIKRLDELNIKLFRFI